MYHYLQSIAVGQLSHGFQDGFTRRACRGWGSYPLPPHQVVLPKCQRRGMWGHFEPPELSVGGRTHLEQWYDPDPAQPTPSLAGSGNGKKNRSYSAPGSAKNAISQSTCHCPSLVMVMVMTVRRLTPLGPRRPQSAVGRHTMVAGRDIHFSLFPSSGIFFT